MVLLTMTKAIVEALRQRSESISEVALGMQGEPLLDSPALGKPISHSQIVDLWRSLRDVGFTEYSLETLLKGCRVYQLPPPPKPEPSAEYKTLMARLRREEEQRAYERMINPPAPTETFARLFANVAPSHSDTLDTARAFAEANRPLSAADLGDDDVTYDEVHRQLMLILNFLVSIFGVATTLWILARWWDTPARLFLTMGGSIVVAVAEVGLYSGYLWHLGQAKKQDKKLSEVKEVVQTWVLGQDDGKTNRGEEVYTAVTVRVEKRRHENVVRRRRV